MNETNQSTAARRHPGRLFLAIGMLLPLIGIAIYYFQFQAKVLRAPWYMAILATGGFFLIGLALVQSRSLLRSLAAAFFFLLAAAEWVFLLVLVSAPPYTGPAKAGQPLPNFSTTRADGSTFTEENLKGDQNTVMVFFRGRW
ncbi:MAG TPA: hypothetical protein VGZ47_22170 [Gemmataceae bacterium]|jgi:hypothetical protein|nr:hypothetical protein [Gemmataceae bacterium]